MNSFSLFFLIFLATSLEDGKHLDDLFFKKQEKTIINKSVLSSFKIRR